MTISRDELRKALRIWKYVRPRGGARDRFRGNKSRLLPRRKTFERGSELRRLRRVGDAGTDRIQIDN